MLSAHRLRMFFFELIRTATRHPGTIGFPCSWLVEQMCLYQESLIDRIMGDHTGMSHECRLNEAGLKMYWRVDRKDRKRPRLSVRIGGDQAKDYPQFVAEANKLVKRFGLERSGSAARYSGDSRHSRLHDDYISF